MVFEQNKHMKPNTIAFVDYKHGTCFAYDYNYYISNRNIILHELTTNQLSREDKTSEISRVNSFTIGGIYFKVEPRFNETDPLKTWIDLTPAMRDSNILEDLDGDIGFDNMARIAYDKQLFNVYPARVIPHTIYSDESGITEEIVLNDGYDHYIKEAHIYDTSRSYTGDIFEATDGFMGDSISASNVAKATSYRILMTAPDKCGADDILYAVNGLFFGDGDRDILRRDSLGRGVYLDNILDLIAVDTPFKTELLPDDHVDNNTDKFYMISPKLIKWQGIKIESAVNASEIIEIASTPVENGESAPSGGGGGSGSKPWVEVPIVYGIGGGMFDQGDMSTPTLEDILVKLKSMYMLEDDSDIEMIKMLTPDEAAYDGRLKWLYVNNQFDNYKALYLHSGSHASIVSDPPMAMFDPVDGGPKGGGIQAFIANSQGGDDPSEHIGFALARVRGKIISGNGSVICQQQDGIPSADDTMQPTYTHAQAEVVNAAYIALPHVLSAHVRPIGKPEYDRIGDFPYADNTYMGQPTLKTNTAQEGVNIATMANMLMAVSIYGGYNADAFVVLDFTIDVLSQSIFDAADEVDFYMPVNALTNSGGEMMG